MNPSGLTRLPLAALAVVLVAILLMACSKDKDSESGKDNPARLDQQVLRTRVASSDPKTIDPHLANFGNETTLDKPLFSTLFTFDESLRAMPDLASELPTPDNGGISKDGLVYTIKIRKDAKWSDGKPLTANDFVYSLKRAMDPKLAGPYTSNYFMIKGAEAYNTAFGNWANVGPQFISTNPFELGTTNAMTVFNINGTQGVPPRPSRVAMAELFRAHPEQFVKKGTVKKEHAEHIQVNI